MCKYNRGREGVKTVKTLSGCIMTSRPDVMQLFFFFSLSSEKHRLTMKRRSVGKFCNVVCLHVCIAFPLGPFFALKKHRCQGLPLLHIKYTADTNSQKQGVDKLLYNSQLRLVIQERRNHKLHCVHNKHKVQCSMLYDWGVAVILPLLQKRRRGGLFFSAVIRSVYMTNTTIISKVTNTETHHEKHQMQVTRLREL